MKGWINHGSENAFEAPAFQSLVCICVLMDQQIIATNIKAARQKGFTLICSPLLRAVCKVIMTVVWKRENKREEREREKGGKEAVGTRRSEREPQYTEQRIRRWRETHSEGEWKNKARGTVNKQKENSTCRGNWSHSEAAASGSRWKGSAADCWQELCEWKRL